MTKETFMYIIGITDEEELENLMLLAGEDEPEDGDWTEMTKKYYEDLRHYAIYYEQKYITFKEVIESSLKAA